MMTNEDYLQEYIQTRGLSKSREYSMRTVLNNYSKHQNLTLDELILEADNEEEQGIRWKRRTLKRRLTSYMNYLKNNYLLSSANAYLNIVISFYNHHEITVGKLPVINQKNSNLSAPIRYQDLPNKDIIREAYNIAEPLMRALLLFLSSTGLSKVDALSLTINDYLQATYPYHETEDIIQALDKMKFNEDIVPTWTNRRSKTNKYYITFNTPEATDEINCYLISRLLTKGLKEDDKLFKISTHHYTRKFERLNDTLGLGKAGTYNRLRGHMLRKFHASSLSKAGMDMYRINILQGKSNNSVDEVYFFEDEEKLREDYINCMDALLIFTDVKEITKYSPEYQAVLDENRLLKENLDKINRIEGDIERLKSWYVVDYKKGIILYYPRVD